MRSSVTFVAVALILGAVSAWAALPEQINVSVKNLSPESTVYDPTRHVFYQSNMYKGLVEVYDPDSREHFNVRIPGVSSGGDGEQQMSGLSISTHDNAKRVYAVTKDYRAFNFADQRNNGPASFHAFNLPLKENSKPKWSVDLKDVQQQFEDWYGTRPFGSVASTQDKDGNSYIVFALGLPAIAKVTPYGNQVIAWAHEDSNGKQRPGYTGIAYDPATNHLLAFGGPRPLTSFNLNTKNPKPKAVSLNGDFGSLDGTEKIKYIPVNGETVLVGARAPDAVSFKTSDNWKSADIKTTSLKQLRNSGFTDVTDYYSGDEQGIYASSAFFDNGAHGGRSKYPLYKLSNSILH
ncbi:hypothetical protein MSPP1_000885 [Malassezia sp. CBS 17886]|nr:hypothetical protein MSPP1_000885 [Malassezia sp. CBS 17886]